MFKGSHWKILEIGIRIPIILRTDRYVFSYLSGPRLMEPLLQT